MSLAGFHGWLPVRALVSRWPHVHRTLLLNGQGLRWKLHFAEAHVPTVRVAVGAWLLLTLLACASSGAFDTLPARERDRFERCWRQMDEPICGTTGSNLARHNCRNEHASQYAAGADEEARNRWLLANGCPPSMVRPDQY